MRKKRPVLPLVLAVILAVGMFQPMPAAAANLYFTGINDSVAPLTSSSMPYWSGGTLYVPYTVFDANQNGVGVSLGLYTSYNHRSHIVTIFNLKQMLVFDLERGTCRDDMTGAAYDAQAVMRYGKPYVPLYVVCSVFGLEYSYNQLSYISQGYLVRIKSADAVLDDGLFIDRARELINNRLRDYTQSLSPAETTPTIPVSPSEPPEVDGGNVATYLAFRCESADGLSAILNTLDGTGQYALFFLAPQVIEEEGGLVRRILGTGHSVGKRGPQPGPAGPGGAGPYPHHPGLRPGRGAGRAGGAGLGVLEGDPVFGTRRFSGGDCLRRHRPEPAGHPSAYRLPHTGGEREYCAGAVCPAAAAQQ